MRFFFYRSIDIIMHYVYCLFSLFVIIILITISSFANKTLQRLYNNNNNNNNDLARWPEITVIMKIQLYNVRCQMFGLSTTSPQKNKRTTSISDDTFMSISNVFVYAITNVDNCNTGKSSVTGIL